MAQFSEKDVVRHALVTRIVAAYPVGTGSRPGPTPACSDAELLAILVVRHLLGRRSEAGFLAEVVRDWAHLFPALPHQSEANRRIRWLWGAFEQLRAMLAARLPVDDCQQVDTTALPVKHTSRVRGPDGWSGPGNDLAARFGRDAAHAEWFYGFRLAIRTDLGRRIVRAWSIVPAAVEPIVQEVVEAFRYSLAQQGFKVDVDIEPDLPELALDAEAIKQALANLVDNAIKYSGDRRRLRVSARVVDREVRIDVADEGIGVPPGEARRIFDKFYRVGRSETQGRRGSGLGLALVKHIVEAHGGRVSVDSRVGEGSRFSLHFPLAP